MSEHTPWRIAEYQSRRAKGALVMVKDATGDYIAECVPRKHAPVIAQAWTIPALREALETITDRFEEALAATHATRTDRQEIKEARAALKLGQDNG